MIRKWDVWNESMAVVGNEKVDVVTAWVWVNSGSWWWTGRPGVLRIMGSQRVGHDWATELNWTDWALGIDKVNFQLVKLSLRICWEDIPGPSGDGLGMRERFSSTSSSVHHPRMQRFSLAPNMFPLGVASLPEYSWVWRSWLKANRTWIRKDEENQIIIHKSLSIFAEIVPLFLFKVGHF